MAIPVPIPSGALPVTDPDTVRAEAFVAAITQVIKSGTSGGTPSIGTPATLVPDSVNPAIDPLTGLPKISSLVLDTPQAQLWYRQFAIAMAKVVPGWSGGGGGPSLGNLVFNEVPVGVINGSNKTFTTANVFVTSSTCLYYNGQRLLLGVDYTEAPGPTPPLNAGVIITALFPAPKVGDNLVIDYVKV